MVVRLRRKDPRYSDLTPHRNYVVIGIEADHFRVLNDQGKPYLYPPTLFEIVDPTEPDDWVIEFGDAGERYAYPPEINESGFFEDFFDNKKAATATFWQCVNERLAMAAGPV